jgi:hypothetical protein
MPVAQSMVSVTQRILSLAKKVTIVMHMVRSKAYMMKLVAQDD